MKRIIDLGKVDYNNSGRKNCKVTIEIEIKDNEKGKSLSIYGNIWNPKQTDIYCGGQCYEEIEKLFPYNKRVKRIIEIWKRWHLNDLRAGCEHQRGDNWERQRIDPKKLPSSNTNRDESGILAIWVDEEEHPKGLLNKACPICGYKYGTLWLHEELPEKIIMELETLETEYCKLIEEIED